MTRSSRACAQPALSVNGATMAGRETGAALYMAVVSLVVLMSISTAMVVTGARTKEECAAVLGDLRARCLAEAGLARAVVDLNAGGTGTLGSATAPVVLGEGSYYVTTAEQPESLCYVVSRGRAGGTEKALRATVRRKRGVFHHAMFIGNSSNDPTYVLRLGGVGPAGDVVNGDVFCNGDVSIEYDANVNGTIRASGTISGATGETGYEQTPPDLGMMNYPVNNDVNVASEFESGASYQSAACGGSAYQVPADMRSHIFRKNPSDRATNCNSTEKDDYFLEDPYEAVTTGSTTSFTSATPITLSGVGGSAGASGNGLVYYVDGNVWIHNTRTYSFGIAHNQPDGVQITIVARGNIYFSDNFLLKNADRDAAAFVALTDPEVADSGNIYFGDPTYGTIAKMEAFMYAENNFKDLNLDGAGSQTIEIRGIMSAGNQVQVARDNSTRWGTTTHAKLTVTLDERVGKNEVTMPGLPFLDQASNSDAAFTIVSVMPVSNAD